MNSSNAIECRVKTSENRRLATMDRQTYIQIKQMSRKATPDLMRTFMANERTFLSFIRTALALLILAFTFIKFFNNLLIEVVGYVFVFFAVATFAVGLGRYARMKAVIKTIHQENHKLASEIDKVEDPF